MRAVVTVLLVVALHAAGVASFGPAFSGRPGWVAAGGGVLVGVGVAALAAWRRLGLLLTAAVALVAYLLFGAALAIPRTAIAGVVPSLDSLQRLALLLVQSWQDLLTVTTPADRFTGPAVVPYLTGLVCGVVAASIALRTRRTLLALIPPVILLIVGIAWGTDTALAPSWLAAGLVVAAVAYAGWQRRVAAHRGAGELVGGTSRSWLPLTAGIVALAVLAGAAGVAGPRLPGTERHVLRELVEPPLDLHAFASPLTRYRYWEVDQADTTLFTVAGLPEGARLRIATLDVFDGNVYNVAQSSANFVRAGDRIDGPRVGTEAELDITVGEYAGIWLPGTGAWRGIEFLGPNATAQGDNLYHSEATTTAITTAGVAPGDRYRVVADVTAPADRKALATARTATDNLPRADQVPDVVGENAQDYSGDADTAVGQLSQLEKRLQEGYYSNGSDGKSRAGHTAERIATLLSAPQLIGDDEQYAVAMALMARELGYPARVVLGFYPDPEQPAAPGGGAAGPWAVKGTEAHVWVEVDFGAAGWVPFDPTPDRDRIPQTEVPQPQPKPRPQVPPPPQPPPADADEEIEANTNDRRGGDTFDLSALFAVLRIIGQVLAIGAIGAAPFLLIAAAKTRRRRLRQHAAEPADRVSGAWDELMDTAIDLGQPPPRNATRLEEAHSLASAYPQLRVLPAARTVNTHVYGPTPPDSGAVDAAWESATALLTDLRTSQPPWRRFVGFCSLRSFWRGRGVPRRGARPMPGPEQGGA